MPRLTRLAVRGSLLYLVVGFGLGAALLAAKVGLAPAGTWVLRTAHVEFLVFGWIVQLTLGVAFWILPRFARRPVRGNLPAAWSALLLLNLGVLLVGVGAALRLPGLYALTGRVAEAGAVLAFAVHAWPRVKPTRRPGEEEGGASGGRQGCVD